jgi:hypothetical protein
VVVYEPDPELTMQSRRLLSECGKDFSGHFVHDRLTLHLLLQRKRPAVLCFSLDDDVAAQTVERLRQGGQLKGIKLIGMSGRSVPSAPGSGLDQILTRPFGSKQLYAALRSVLGEEPRRRPAPVVPGEATKQDHFEPCGGAV